MVAVRAKPGLDSHTLRDPSQWIFFWDVQMSTALHAQMTYAGSMILAFTALLGVTLGSVLISLLLWQKKQQTASPVIQIARRS
jgi:hypothetical protein